jgi:hypothetical protein
MKSLSKNSVVATTIVAALLALGLFGAMVAFAAGPATVNLGGAGNFVILSKAGITDVPSSVINGNIGTSPINGAAIGVTCAEMKGKGKIYQVDAAYVGSGDTTCAVTNATLLGTAVGDMETAYTTANGLTAGVTELGAGEIGGLTLAPGVYKWSTPVTISTNVTLKGGKNDVWVFQIAGTLDIASGGSVPTGIKVILKGGAQAKNIFWVVAGATTLGTYSTFNGTILGATNIALQTGAVLTGRALAQTAVTLDTNTISK